jgi:hypothetical protein
MDGRRPAPRADTVRFSAILSLSISNTALDMSNYVPIFNNESKWLFNPNHNYSTTYTLRNSIEVRGILQAPTISE